MTKVCPIDGTKLGPLNQYPLKDAVICKKCAKKLGLVGIHQSLQLANAAQALLTLDNAKADLSSNQKIDYKKLKADYKSAVNTGDALTGREMFKTQMQEIDEHHARSVNEDNKTKHPQTTQTDTKNHCSICGSPIKLLDQHLKFKDGYVCQNCCQKVGMNSTYSDISWAGDHSVADVKQLIDDHRIIDTKSIALAKKEALKAEKLEQKQAKKDQVAAAQQTYVDAKNEFKKSDTEIFGFFYFNPTIKKVFRDRSMKNHDYRVFNYSDIINYQAVVKGHNDSKKHGPISSLLSVEDDTEFDHVEEIYVTIQLNDGSAETGWLADSKTGKTMSSVVQDDLKKLCSLLDQILTENDIPVATRISYIDTTLNTASQVPGTNNVQPVVISEPKKKPSRKAPHCPRCKSNNIQIMDNKRKFSMVKTVAGGMMFNAPGAVAGALIGKRGKKYHAVCMDCGKKFDIKL